MKNTIHITKKNIIFRTDAQKLFRRVSRYSKHNGAKRVVIDFKNVDFFSRSFIDEFLNGVDRFKKKGITIQTKNVKPFLQKFINRVRKTKTQIQKELSQEM